MDLDEIRKEEARVAAFVEPHLEELVSTENLWDTVGVVTSKPHVRKIMGEDPVEEVRPLPKSELRRKAIRKISVDSLYLVHLLDLIHDIEGDTAFVYKFDGDNNPVTHLFVVGSEEGKRNVLEKMVSFPGTEVIETSERTSFTNYNGEQRVIGINGRFIINVYVLPDIVSPKIFEMDADSKISTSTGHVLLTTISGKEGVLYKGDPNTSKPHEYADYATNLRLVGKEIRTLERMGRVLPISSMQRFNKALDIAIEGYKINPKDCAEEVVYCAFELDPEKYTVELLSDPDKLVAVYDSDNGLASFRKDVENLDEKEMRLPGTTRILEINLDKLFSNIPEGSELYKEVKAEAERQSVNHEDAVDDVKAVYASMIVK